MKAESCGSKEAICSSVESMEAELWELAVFLHDHPELSGQEILARQELVSWLDRKGFECELGVAGIETAFVGWGGACQRPAIAFIAEYDALPELGHACGHNLIAASAVGAAVALATACPELAGHICVIGTPAEEVSKLHVKQTMLDKGVFSNIDVALMMHPSDRTTTMGRNLAVDSVQFRFQGKPAHASKYPHLGASALDGAILTMTALEFLREHVRSDVRIHGIVSDGGLRANIVPEHASLSYMVRAETRSTLDEIKNRVLACAQAGALATGTTVEIDYEKGNDNKLLLPLLSDLLLANAVDVGADQVLDPEKELGSTDFGNVSHQLPSATLKVAFVPQGTPGHSRAWVKASRSERARKGVSVASKAMALTAERVLADPALLDQIQEQFEEIRLAEG